MKSHGLMLAIGVFVSLTFSSHVKAQTDFDDMTPAEKLAARNQAATQKLDFLKVCSDAGNMPFSNLKGEGFENKIAEILAQSIGAQLSYYWRPALERGMTRAAFATDNVCDVLIDVPADYDRALTTLPIYRTTYVFAYRSDKGIEPFKGLDDPRLKTMKVGAFETSGLREALAQHGVTNVDVHPVTYDGDLVEQDQPWWQVEQVAQGKLDVAAVWGPFAGYVKAKKGAPLTIQPANRMEDTIPLEFSLAIGVRRTDALLKYMIENALQKHRDEIKKILSDFGVPLVQCGTCIISGDVPSHGTYYTPEVHLTRPTDTTTGEAPHVSDAEVNKWLKEGLDLNSALNGAVLASDLDRIRFLLGKGANVNSRDGLGQYPLHVAADQRDMDVIAELLDSKADIEARDSDGWTPLMRAAARDNVPAIQLLISRRAKVDAVTPDGYTALAYALVDGQFAAAKALIEAGASVSTPVGPEKLTPLMIAASQLPKERREMALIEGLGPLEIAHLLAARGASVNAKSAAGMTALMVAAVHNNPAMIATLAQMGADLSTKENGGRTARDLAVANSNEAALRILDVLASTAPKTDHHNNKALN